MKEFVFENKYICDVTVLPSGVLLVNNSRVEMPGNKHFSSDFIAINGNEVCSISGVKGLWNWSQRKSSKKKLLYTEVFTPLEEDLDDDRRVKYVGLDGKPTTKKRFAVNARDCLPHPDYYAMSVERPEIKQIHNNEYYEGDNKKIFALLSLAAGSKDRCVVIVHYPTKRVFALNLDRHYYNIMPSNDGMVFVAWDNNECHTNHSRSHLLVFDNPFMTGDAL